MKDHSHRFAKHRARKAVDLLNRESKNKAGKVLSALIVISSIVLLIRILLEL